MEEFRKFEINGFVYSIGNKGTIKNESTGNKLKPIKTKDGYLQVGIGKGSLKKKMYVHRLVAMAFVEGFSDIITINHKDYNKENNHFENLECISREDNARHSYMKKHKQIGQTNTNAKLTLEDVKTIKKLLNYKADKEIASMFNVGRTTIYDIRKENTWKRV